MPAPQPTTPLILAFDTSTETCSVALMQGGRLLGEHERGREAGFGGHSEHLLELIAALLDSAARELGQLDAIAFGAGPGAFTGLRVACAVAQGLALGLDCPLLPVDCLAAIACAAARSDERPQRLFVAQDARMHELYCGRYEWLDGALITREGPWLARADASAQGAPEHDEVVVGNGARLYPAAFTASLCGFERPRAAAIAMLGTFAWAAGQAVAAEHAAPVYVRDRVALTIAERAAKERLQG